MKENLGKPQSENQQFVTSGIEDRDQLLGLFRGKIAPGTFQVAKEEDHGTTSEYLVVERGGHTLRIHSTFAMSSLDGQRISIEEAKEFWDKFNPLSQ